MRVKQFCDMYKRGIPFTGSNRSYAPKLVFIQARNIMVALIWHIGRIRNEPPGFKKAREITQHLTNMSTLISSDLPNLTLISRGKVRDIYSTSSPDHLLFVASDRISAYDVILQNVSEQSISSHEPTRS